MLNHFIGPITALFHNQNDLFFHGQGNGLYDANGILITTLPKGQRIHHIQCMEIQNQRNKLKDILLVIGGRKSLLFHSISKNKSKYFYLNDVLLSMKIIYSNKNQLNEITDTDKNEFEFDKEMNQKEKIKEFSSFLIVASSHGQVLNFPLLPIYNHLDRNQENHSSHENLNLVIESNSFFSLIKPMENSLYYSATISKNILPFESISILTVFGSIFSGIYLHENSIKEDYLKKENMKMKINIEKSFSLLNEDSNKNKNKKIKLNISNPLPPLQLNHHQGSIFGIDIFNQEINENETKEWICTCSDDRTINIYYQRKLMDTIRGIHGSRIWKCLFIQIKDDMYVISGGEDGILWLNSIDQNNQNQNNQSNQNKNNYGNGNGNELKITTENRKIKSWKWNLSSGNIWSISRNENDIHVGCENGSIWKVKINSNIFERNLNSIIDIVTPIKTRFKINSINQKNENENENQEQQQEENWNNENESIETVFINSNPKSFFLINDILFYFNDLGQLFMEEKNGNGNEGKGKSKEIFYSKELEKYTICSSYSFKMNCIYIGSVNGKLYQLNLNFINNNENGKISELPMVDPELRLVWNFQVKITKLFISNYLNGGVLTSLGNDENYFYSHYENRVILLDSIVDQIQSVCDEWIGTRNGKLYRNGKLFSHLSLNSLTFILKEEKENEGHGDGDGIKKLEMEKNKSFLIVTDRTGHVYHVNTNFPLINSQDDEDISIIQNGNSNKMIKLENLSNIEYAFRMNRNENGNSNEMEMEKMETYYCGFHQKSFKIYSMSDGVELHSIACGGGHRPWIFSPPTLSISNIDDHYDSNDNGNDGNNRNSNSMKFVYSRLGNLHKHEIHLGNSFQNVKRGINSSHIRSICILDLNFDSFASDNKYENENEKGKFQGNGKEKIKDSKLILMGDDQGHLVCIENNEKNKWSKIATRKLHSSTIKDILRIEKNQFITIGAKEECFIWKVSDCNFIKNSNFKREILKIETGENQNELANVINNRRIMTGSVGIDQVLLGYSDGTIRILSIRNNFESLTQIKNEYCILQIKWLERDSIFIVGFTNGIIKIYEITKKGNNNANNSKNIENIENQNNLTREIIQFKLHQSGINSIDTRGGNLILTGGDDGNVGLFQFDKNVIITHSLNNSPFTRIVMKQISLSAIIGVHFVRDNVWISIGLDQRIYKWTFDQGNENEINDGIGTENDERLKVVLVSITQVADPSNSFLQPIHNDVNRSNNDNDIDNRSNSNKQMQKGYLLYIVGAGLECLQLEL